jgi:polyphosphate kinase
MFLSSADWMPRNFHHRVEVMFPVESERLRQQIREEVIEPALGDNAGAYVLGADGCYTRRAPGPDQPPRSAQAELLERIGKSRGSRLS